MPKSLHVTRGKGFYGKFRKLTLRADGFDIGLVRENETITIVVPDHALELTGKMDWVTTYPFDLLQVSSGDNIEVTVTPRWWRQPAKSLTWLPFQFSKN